MQSPDKAYTNAVTGRTQIRMELGISQGDVDWFVVQLEYNHEPHPGQEDEWEMVARGDHQPQMSWGHDIRKEGLHIDVYENGQKAEVEHYHASIPVNHAPQWIEDHLRMHAGYYLAQYERWHGIAGTHVTE